MARARVDKTQPKTFVAFIMEAINEVAPGQGSGGMLRCRQA
jgi:hypothetical protein